MTLTITVAGAGFSGLTTAYFLVKRGCKVRIVERSKRAGGLIETIQTEHGIVERAANGILASAKLEAIAEDVGVPLLETRREGRKRFIYRGRPRQMPLNIFDALKTGARLATHAISLQPQPLESISAWGRRVGGAAATDYLLTPALGGIYAGDPDRLSARLIFGKAKLPGHLHTNKPAKGNLHGTLAPSGGMEQLTKGLRAWLERSGTEFVFNLDSVDSTNGPVVVCLPANAAADYLKPFATDLSQALSGIEMLSLVTATAFFASADRDRSPQGSTGKSSTSAVGYDRAETMATAKLNGFGCLFPRDQGFRARGVLFNNSIFEGRGPAHSETWIFGGALDPEVMELTDDQFRELIADEREKFYGQRNEPLAVYVNRRRAAIPHYTIELERILTSLPAPPPNIALVGNYLGRIGLAKLIERAAVVAAEMQDRLR